MSTKSVFAVGFLSVIVATGLFVASNSVADEARRVDVIDAPHEEMVQKDSTTAEGEASRVDVIGSIGSEGPVYPYTKPLSH